MTRVRGSAIRSLRSTARRAAQRSSSSAACNTTPRCHIPLNFTHHMCAVQTFIFSYTAVTQQSFEMRHGQARIENTSQS